MRRWVHDKTVDTVTSLWISSEGLPEEQPVSHHTLTQADVSGEDD
jgi:hypothetical protein